MAGPSMETCPDADGPSPTPLPSGSTGTPSVGVQDVASIPHPSQHAAAPAGAIRAPGGGGGGDGGTERHPESCEVPPFSTDAPQPEGETAVQHRMKQLKTAGNDLVESMKVAGSWAGHHMSAFASYVTSGGSAQSTAAPGATGCDTINKGKALKGSGASAGPMGMHATHPPSAKGNTEWRFEAGDTVIAQEGCTLLGPSGEVEMPIPTGSCVTVTAPPEGGLVAVRFGETSGHTAVRAVSHPVTTLRVNPDAAVGCDVVCKPSPSPTLRRLLGGDLVCVIRAKESPDNGVWWYQTMDGGWVAASPLFQPLYAAGLCIKVTQKVEFDNGRRVSAGCFGIITKVPGDAPGSVAEVVVDGVTWDATRQQVEPLLPQSQVTPSECLRRGVPPPPSDSESDTAEAERDGSVISEDDSAFDDSDDIS
eukprot:TRINITY_DN21923_c0_g1_i1.p1 TRINITY_DN21923_c0_g1~~TRINITY_DN21923_c0_g1_i1.p1  ORF type:complete len:421 (+),score=58.20 TRINITY_DN21923_c0_g1_i1:62-1324(+)